MVSILKIAAVSAVLAGAFVVASETYSGAAPAGRVDEAPVQELPKTGAVSEPEIKRPVRVIPIDRRVADYEAQASGAGSA